MQWVLVVGSLSLYLHWVHAGEHGQECRQPPNIVIILADDLGWNDVSFHGSNQFQTPNIDALAYSGLILNNYYTQPICTPSRAALLTGRHPIHNGMHHTVIYAPEPWGLPLTEELLPQKLKRRGYVTRAVGKWHLGFFKSAYTPTHRGFDSHYGSWLGKGDHFTHYGFKSHPGFDFRRDFAVAHETEGKYEVDLLAEEAERLIGTHNISQPLFLYMSHMVPHAPLQAPQELIHQFDYIPDKKRRIFAAMVTKLDESVGRITEALKRKSMLNNTIILLLSDNGGATNGFNGNVASNFPLRGGKDTLYEGGVRVVAFIWSPLLQGTPRVHTGLVNVQDWLPTLIEATGVKANNSAAENRKVDGVSQWAALSQQALSTPNPALPLTPMLHNIDPLRRIKALRYGPWKIVIGRTYNGTYDGHYGQLRGEIAYDLSAIRGSMAGRALEETSSPLPGDWTMQEMRREASISCHPHPHPRPTSVSEPCEAHTSPCLFNIEEDPCELHNVASQHPRIVGKLKHLLKQYHVVRPRNRPSDPRSYPENWNNKWVPWKDFD